MKENLQLSPVVIKADLHVPQHVFLLLETTADGKACNRFSNIILEAGNWVEISYAEPLSTKDEFSITRVSGRVDVIEVKPDSIEVGFPSWSVVLQDAVVEFSDNNKFSQTQPVPLFIRIGDSLRIGKSKLFIVEEPPK